MYVPCDKMDRDLVFPSTIVSVGKGDLAPFWLCSWVDGSAPRNIAPMLFASDTTYGILGGPLELGFLPSLSGSSGFGCL